MLALTVLSGLAAVAAANPSLADCRQLDDDRARLACYDTAAGRPAAKAPSPPAVTPAAPTPTAEDLFGRDVAETAAIAREAAGIGQVEAIEAIVFRADRNAYGKLVVTLSNGQSWQQIDSVPLALKTGMAVRIRRAALDSYLLSPADGGRNIRVHRRQ